MGRAEVVVLVRVGDEVSVDVVDVGVDELVLELHPESDRRLAVPASLRT